MRIVGGKDGGRIIKMPDGVVIRPTQDRVREAMFNVIRESIPGSRVLDLYAGSGAFGIEALSRGAHSSIFVDDNTKCTRVIKSNLRALEASRQECAQAPLDAARPYRRLTGQVLKKDALKAISHFKDEDKKFDIIFLDPPYYKDLAKNALIKIGAYDILSQRGFAIAEHFIKDEIPAHAGGLKLFKEKRYGDTVLSFYRKNQ